MAKRGWGGCIWMRWWITASSSSASIHHQLTNENIAQVIVYMAATGLRVGILLNFGRKRRI